ncbi:MAG: aminotransferase class V-fold PLP-dependent enzyme [Gammaproteobacteria bacterium]|nr:aminotransferase class V-fold PLP-dependent enzyme [Gammaproteobacteria bacterium]
MSTAAAIPNATDWPAIRARFPIFENRTFMNSCSYGALSTDVMHSLHTYIDDRMEKGTDWAQWVERNENVRAGVARLIAAVPDEVAVTTSASQGINAIASAMDFNAERNKVVISDYAFPTNAQIWYAQQARGAEVVQIGERDGYIPPEAFAEVIDEKTRIVAVSQVCFRNGAKLDIPAITEIARQNGAYVLVDGYQSLGTVEFDVNEMGVDFLIGGFVKYLLGSAGVAFAYVRKDLVEKLVPTATGWFAQADIFAMDNTKYDPSPTARRFESGTPPVPNCYVAEAALRIIEEAGLAAIVGRIQELTTAIKDRAREAGYRFGMPDDPSKHAAMITLRSTDEHGLVAALEADRIVTSCRGGNLRVSPHFYNNFADIDALFDSLAKHRHLLA